MIVTGLIKDRESANSRGRCIAVMYGLQYNGYQPVVKNGTEIGGFMTFTDPINGSSFCSTDTVDTLIKLQKLRKSYADQT